MKRVVILGSTGSIGVNALNVLREMKKEFSVVGLTGHGNFDLLMEQINEFKPKYVSFGKEEGAKKIKLLFPEIEVYYGDEGLKKMGALKDYDIILTAVSGFIGIDATVEAIKNSKRIALANKETMVAAGKYINSLLKTYPKAEIIPVDSEHSALFQCMLSGNKNEISKLIITASGGPFRGKKKEELEKVTVKDALKHPNWVMGKKITIDSATLVNKGLEVIEAHELFGIPYEDIEVLVHPQSIIHSMVEFKDTSIMAQMGVPSMKLPIQYALTYEKRGKNSVLEKLDLKKMSVLTFEEPDCDTFLGLNLAYKAGKIGETMPAVFNAANEVAVELFLGDKISFLEIYKLINEAMEAHILSDGNKLEEIKKADDWARQFVYNKNRIS